MVQMFALSSNTRKSITILEASSNNEHDIACQNVLRSFENVFTFDTHIRTAEIVIHVAVHRHNT